MTVCPCCRREWDAAPEIFVDLNSNRLVIGETQIEVRAKMAEFCAAVLSKGPNFISRDRLITRIWGLEDEPEDANNVLAVMGSRLRKLIQPYGFDLQCQSYIGYRIIKGVNTVNIGKPWSDAEWARFYKLAALGYTATQISADIQRPVSTVRLNASKKKVRLGRARKNFQLGRPARALTPKST